MINREQANQLYVGSNVQEQLGKLEEVIRKVAPTARSLTLATSGYTKEWMEKQAKLWPNFQGLSPETVQALKENGFTVKHDSSYRGTSWVIEW